MPSPLTTDRRTTPSQLMGLVNPSVRMGSSSVIRDLLAVIDRPRMLSMAAGLPAPELLPVDRLGHAVTEVLADHGPRALQYAPTEGIPELRDWVGRRHRVPAADVIITTGSQQGLDLLARALLSPADTVVVEAPGYLGAIEAFRMTGAKLVAVPGDEDGLDTERLGRGLDDGLRPALVHVVTNFQNPSGATLSGPRRRHLADLAERYGFVVVEDDPYGELRFRGPVLPRMAELTDHAVTLGTVSKILSPGLRVGWMVAPSWLVRPIVQLKQIADLHTSPFNQLLAASVVADEPFMATHVARLRRTYASRADALVQSIRALPDSPITIGDPDGGLFGWAHLEVGPAADVILPAAIEAGVAFVPGSAFAIDGGDHRHHLRLCFSTLAENDLAIAVGRLAGLVRA